MIKKLSTIIVPALRKELEADGKLGASNGCQSALELTSSLVTDMIAGAEPADFKSLLDHYHRDDFSGSTYKDFVRAFNKACRVEAVISRPHREWFQVCIRIFEKGKRTTAWDCDMLVHINGGKQLNGLGFNRP